MIGIVLAFFVGSSAQAFDVGGELGHSYFRTAEGQLESVVMNRSSGELELRHEWGRTFGLEFRPRVDWIYESSLPSENPREKALVELREGFFAMEKKRFQLIAGKRILSWGSSDILNPTDFFGSKDQTRWSADDEERRLGVTGFFTSWSGSVWRRHLLTLETAAIFAGLESKPLVVISDPMAEIGYQGRHSQVPSFGARARFEADTWDLSFSGFYGQSHESEFQYLGFGPQGAKVDLIHQKMKAIGIDGSWSKAKWIFRTEAATRSFELREGTDFLLSPDRSEWVIGVERPLGSHFRFHAQYFLRQQREQIPMNSPVSAQELALLQGLQKSNQWLSGFTEDQEQGFTLRGTLLLFDERLQAQAVGVALLNSQSSLVRPSLQWTGFGNWILTGGYIFYSGDETTALGQMKVFSSSFVEVQFVF